MRGRRRGSAEACVERVGCCSGFGLAEARDSLRLGWAGTGLMRGGFGGQNGKGPVLFPGLTGWREPAGRFWGGAGSSG